MYEKFGQFINGKWQQSSDKGTYEVINPANEEVLQDMHQKQLQKMLRQLYSQRQKDWKFGKKLLLGKDLIL